MVRSCWKCGAPPGFLLPTTTLSLSSPAELTPLLISNQAPLDSEVLALRELVAGRQDRLNALNAQIDSLQETLAQLIQQRDEAAESIRDYKTVMSPLRRVPPELLCEIFLLTSPHTRLIGGKPTKQPPWYIGHVCRLWRHAALSYPLLWTNIEIHFRPNFSFKANYPLSMIETQLLRSANAPLEVIFDWWPGQIMHDGVDLRVLEAVFLHINRWRSLDLQDARFTAVLDLLQAAPGCLSSLHRLDFIQHDYEPGGWSPITDVFTHASSLREVILTVPILSQTSRSLDIPWGQITRYRGAYTLERQLEILRTAPNLIECGIGCTNWGAMHESPGHYIVTLAHLRRLHAGQAGFLSYLNAPLLGDLMLWDCSATDIVSFVQRSSCQLTKLTLGLSSFTHSAATTILKHIPTLTYFHTENNGSASQENRHLFDAMSFKLSDPPSTLCPRLSSFLYGLRSISAAGCTKSLVAMIKSRSQPTSSHRLSFIRLFYIPQNDPPSDDLRLEIQMLADQGINVALIDFDEVAQLVQDQLP
ncbi:hypothetical protein DFH09DRAFT_1136110 [Mycena vulgaris]|nr:hypothetical protein DFH09DRAFT_1136110 [Mycena vulgaris]